MVGLYFIKCLVLKGPPLVPNQGWGNQLKADWLMECPLACHSAAENIHMVDCHLRPVSCPLPLKDPRISPALFTLTPVPPGREL